MKKQYFRPVMRVVEIQNSCRILAGSVTSVNNSDGFIYNGGGSGYGRAPLFDSDEWE
jgi:hypothetical protein